MRKLFSYVVEHDHGRSPNPFGGYCTLAFCKFKEPGDRKRNVVELAAKEDWIVGTGGASRESAGHGRLVYAMLVTEKMNLRDYFRDPRFADRAGNRPEFAGRTDMFALVSNHFYYFGKEAPQLAPRHLAYPIERGGRGHRNKFPQRFIDDFVAWIAQFSPGVHGDPCGATAEPTVIQLGMPARPTKRRCQPSKCN
jgi:hypothetical protein